jgi:hypothetical protein
MRRPQRKIVTSKFTDTTTPGGDGLCALWNFRLKGRTSHEWVVGLSGTRAGSARGEVLEKAAILDKMLTAAIGQVTAWKGAVPAEHTLNLKTSDLP